MADSGITADQVKPFLTELGYSIPDALLTPILCRVNSITDCLQAAGYDSCTQTLILMNAAALMCASSGARRIKSQGAPNGASRSFDYGSDSLTWLHDSLSDLDTAGCTASLPITAGSDSVGFFMVTRG